MIMKCIQEKNLLLKVWSMAVFDDRLMEWMKGISSMIINRLLKLKIS